MQPGPNYDKLYEISESQAGYFTARQAQQAGFSPERLTVNAQTGQFLRVARGVYRLKRFPGSPNEDLFVAWLRAGPGAVISHESALALYDLSDVLPSEVHLIVPRTASRRRPGIRQHTSHLKPEEVIRRNGLPITTVERTLRDVINSGLAQEQVRRAIREALRRGLTDRDKLAEYARRAGRKAGAEILHILAGGTGEV